MSGEVTSGQDLGKIRMAWKNYGFGAERSDWYEYAPIEQGEGAYHLEGRGVCFAFVRRWLQLLERGERDYTAVYSIRNQWQDIINTQKTTKFSQGWASTKLNKMDGMGLNIQTRHYNGAQANLAKGSRGILDAIFGSGVGMGPEMSDGLRLFCLSAGGQGTEAGHAIGFAVSSSMLYFLDPNIGQFWCHGATEGVRTNFREWFVTVFWPGAGYKASYAHGERVLVEFLPNSNSINGTIEPVKKAGCTLF